jgi:hypothetical protein
MIARVFLFFLSSSFDLHFSRVVRRHASRLRRSRPRNNALPPAKTLRALGHRVRTLRKKCEHTHQNGEVRYHYYYYYNDESGVVRTSRRPSRFRGTCFHRPSRGQVVFVVGGGGALAGQPPAHRKAARARDPMTSVGDDECARAPTNPVLEAAARQRARARNKFTFTRHSLLVHRHNVVIT